MELPILLRQMKSGIPRKRLSSPPQSTELSQGRLLSLLYEWSWGAPGLFPASAEDLSTGKRVQDLEDVHSVFRLAPSLGAGVTFVLRFEKPISFTKDPVFRVFGQGDLMVAEKTGEVLLVQRSSLYIVYVCRFASIPYGQVTAQWRPR